MAIAFDCERCGQHFEVGEALAGRRSRCRRCGHEFAIPDRRRPGPEHAGPPPTAPARPPEARPRDQATPRGWFAFECERCGRRFDVEGGHAGRRGRCLRCGHEFIIPGPRQPEARPSEAARGRGDEVAPVPPRPSRPAPAGMPPTAAQTAFDGDGPSPLPSRQATPRRRAAPASVRRSPRPERAKYLTADIPPWAYLAGGALGLALSWPVVRTLPTGWSPAWGVVVALGFLLAGMGAVGGLVVALRESFVCGLLYLLVPFYSLYYLVTRWDAMRKIFGVLFAGFVLMMVPALCVPGFLLAHRSFEWARALDLSVASTPSEWLPAPARLKLSPGATTFERDLKDLIAVFNELADVLDGITDPESALRARPALERIAARFRELSLRPNVIVTQKELDWLKEQYTEALRAPMARLNASTERIRRDAGLPDEPPPFPTDADGRVDVSGAFQFSRVQRHPGVPRWMPPPPVFPWHPRPPAP